jgi:hypothetical protein
MLRRDEVSLEDELAIHSASNSWTSPKMRWSDPCTRKLEGKNCRRNQCGYLHEDQKDIYKDDIAKIKFCNKDEEDAAIEQGMMDEH